MAQEFRSVSPFNSGFNTATSEEQSYSPFNSRFNTATKLGSKRPSFIKRSMRFLAKRSPLKIMSNKGYYARKKSLANARYELEKKGQGLQKAQNAMKKCRLDNDKLKQELRILSDKHQKCTTLVRKNLQNAAQKYADKDKAISALEKQNENHVEAMKQQSEKHVQALKTVNDQYAKAREAIKRFKFRDPEEHRADYDAQARRMANRANTQQRQRMLTRVLQNTPEYKAKMARRREPDPRKGLSEEGLEVFDFLHSGGKKLRRRSPAKKRRSPAKKRRSAAGKRK